ncbi:MAG: hypothetical protein ACTHN3_03635 [Solirubrobacterales bacterium]
MSFKELLLIAEARLGFAYDEMERSVCPFRAELALTSPFVRVCGSYLFPDPVEQAGVCAFNLIRAKLFPRGNRAVGYECMREMLVLSGRVWSSQDEESEDVDDFLKRVEAREVGLAEFIRWVREGVRA